MYICCYVQTAGFSRTLFFFLVVSVVAETEEIQALLKDNGIEVQSVADVRPIRILPARILSHIYVKLGKDAAQFLCLLVMLLTLIPAVAKMLLIYLQLP